MDEDTLPDVVLPLESAPVSCAFPRATVSTPQRVQRHINPFGLPVNGLLTRGLLFPTGSSPMAGPGHLRGGSSFDTRQRSASASATSPSASSAPIMIPGAMRPARGSEHEYHTFA